MEWILILLLLLACALCAVLFHRNRKMYRTIDTMLDEILDGKKVSQSDIREGEISALASKARQLQEKLELELEQAASEKEQVKQLISNMSHQLKTPLAGITMYAEILDSRELPREQQQKFLKKMHLQSAKIDWILQSLFKMTKLEQNVISFEAESLGIRQTLTDAVSAVYEKASRKSISITVEDTPDILLWHNRKWTAEVFSNLLENAVKYTEEGGSIHICFTPLEMYTGIEFRDTGIGIVETDYQKIFRRFYRGKAAENIEGSGIGLYLSKIILEKERGYLTVSSKVGAGSCFTVFLQNCKN